MYYKNVYIISEILIFSWGLNKYIAKTSHTPFSLPIGQ